MKHPRFDEASGRTGTVVEAALAVHRAMGPGLLESIYQRCMVRELMLRGCRCVEQKAVRVEYRGLVFEEVLRCDLLVEDCLLVELKTVPEVLPIHKAQALSYMKLLQVPVGLIVNFHLYRVTDGIHRLILRGANGEGDGGIPW